MIPCTFSCCIDYSMDPGGERVRLAGSTSYMRRQCGTCGFQVRARKNILLDLRCGHAYDLKAFIKSRSSFGLS